MRIIIEAPKLGQLERKLGEPHVRRVVTQELRRAMIESLAIVEEAVVQRTPVNTGALRQGIATKINGTPISALFEGQVFAGGAGGIYGLPVEKGRRAGRMPPPDAIELWVRRKLAVSEEEVSRVAFLIARAIGRRGTVGVHMFEEGLKASERLVGDRFERASDRITAALA
jgi:hypothetical protein